MATVLRRAYMFKGEKEAKERGGGREGGREGRREGEKGMEGVRLKFLHGTFITIYNNKHTTDHNSHANA